MVDDVAFKPPSEYKPELDTPKEEQKEFQQTWLEWASKKKEQIFRWGFAQNNTKTVYQVPNNATFFLTNAALSLHATSATAAGDTYLTIKENINNNRILMIGTFVEDNNTTQTQSFSMPLKIESGELIQVTSTQSTIIGNAEIQGFLIPFS